MNRKWMLPLGFAGLGALAAFALRKRDVKQRDGSWPVNLAHRGASGSFPENTFESFEAGLSSGAGGIETDVHMTRDGEIVVIHDDTLERTTDGFGAVRDMALAELRNLDAGHRFSPDGGRTHPYREQGIRIPTFAEVLHRFPEAFVNVEIKENQPGVERAVLRVIEGAGAEHRIIVASSLHRVIRRFRKTAGGKISTAASRPEIGFFLTFSKLHLEILLRPEYVALQVPLEYRGIRVISPRFLKAAHRRGVFVDVWTIDDPREMHRLLDLGVDTIMTNRPEALDSVLDERGRG